MIILSAISRSDNDGPPPGSVARPDPRAYKLRRLRPAGASDLANASENCSLQSGRVRARGVPAVRDKTRPGVLHVRFQDGPNWFTPQGTWKKRRAIERKGLPKLKGRRFITLTLDPERFGFDSCAGYIAGKDKLRRFLEAGRNEGLWPRGCWWCWKLEFQRNGWAHWHLLIDRKARFGHLQLATLSEIWGLGRVNCRRISTGSFGYQFKYVFKGVYQEDDQGYHKSYSVPEWFLDHYEAPADGSKPRTFSRARFWQASSNFYIGPKAPSRPSKPAQWSILPRPVRQHLDDLERSAVVIARKYTGKYVRSSRIILATSREDFVRHHCWAIENGHACTIGGGSHITDTVVLNRTTNKTDTWKLQQLHRANRLTLRRAQQLRRERVSLQKC